MYIRYRLNISTEQQPRVCFLVEHATTVYCQNTSGRLILKFIGCFFLHGFWSKIIRKVTYMTKPSCFNRSRRKNSKKLACMVMMIVMAMMMTNGVCKMVQGRKLIKYYFHLAQLSDVFTFASRQNIAGRI